MVVLLLVSSGCGTDTEATEANDLRKERKEQLEGFGTGLQNLRSALDNDNEDPKYENYQEKLREVERAYYEISKLKLGLSLDRIQEVQILETQVLTKIHEAQEILQNLIDDQKLEEEAQNKLKGFVESDDLSPNGQGTPDAVKKFLEFNVVERLEILLKGLEGNPLDSSSQSSHLIGQITLLDVVTILLVILLLLLLAIEMWHPTIHDKYHRRAEQHLRLQIDDIRRMLYSVTDKFERVPRKEEYKRIDIELKVLNNLEEVSKKVEQIFNFLNHSKPSSDDSDELNTLVNSFNQGIEKFNNKRKSLGFKCSTVSVSSGSVDEIRKAPGHRVKDMVLRKCLEHKCDFLIVEGRNSSYLFLTSTNIKSTLDEAIPSLFDGFQQQADSRSYDLCQPARVSKINEGNWRLDKQGKIQLRTS